MKDKKLVIGITAPMSVVLLEGQLKYFVNEGYDVYLMAPHDKETLDLCNKEGATLLPIFIKREISLFDDIRTLFKIISIFRKLKPDIVNLGTPKVSFLGMIAARIVNVKTRVYTCRGFRFEHEEGFKRKLLILIERITSACANKVLCISHSVMSYGIELNIFSNKKSIVINKGSSNGINLSSFNPNRLNKVKQQLLKQKHNPEDKFVFGFLGRIVERKGFKELIAAFEKMYVENKDIKLLIAGNIEYDQMDEETIQRAKSHSGIEMVGFVQYDDTPYYYSLMDVFVLPAYWEGFGNVLIQAAAMSLPIIATDVTGCKDAVSDKYNGVLIEAKNTEVLLHTMNEFYDNPEMLLTYSKNGPKWVHNFKPEVIWEGMNDIFKAKI